MLGNMRLIAKKCFPNATRVTDRFHVQKLTTEALQEIRIKYQWQAIDHENQAIEKGKKKQKTIRTSNYLMEETLVNNFWSEVAISFTKLNQSGQTNQLDRANLLFELYPDIQKAYNIARGLRNIF